jgi:hypothetical protein
MAIIASAIFGRSAFTFGRIRIIRFISSEERCPLNMIYKHALEAVGQRVLPLALGPDPSVTEFHGNQSLPGLRTKVQKTRQ